MGVKGLWRLLLPIGRRISIETLEGKILAIDASIWLTQFLKAMRDPDTGSVLPAAHLIGFLRRLAKLRFHGIRPVLVFDGATPEIKLRELQRRRQRRQQVFTSANDESNLQRLAKRLLLEQLKKQKQIKSDTGDTTTHQNGAFAPGFRLDEESSQDTKGGEEKINQPAVSVADDVLADSPDLEATWKERPIDESSENDWDQEIFVEENEDRHAIFDSSSRDAITNTQDQRFVVNRITSLPCDMRKDAIEDAKRQQRLQSRREFMPVAGQPDQYSQTQIRNFLKSSRLNQDIVRMVQQQQQQENQADGKGYQLGEPIASDSSRRILFTKDKAVIDRRDATQRRNSTEKGKHLRQTAARVHSDDEHDDLEFESEEDDPMRASSASSTERQQMEPSLLGGLLSTRPVVLKRNGTTGEETRPQDNTCSDDPVGVAKQDSVTGSQCDGFIAAPSDQGESGGILPLYSMEPKRTPQELEDEYLARTLQESEATHMPVHSNAIRRDSKDQSDQCDVDIRSDDDSDDEIDWEDGLATEQKSGRDMDGDRSLISWDGMSDAMMSDLLKTGTPIERESNRGAHPLPDSDDDQRWDEVAPGGRTSLTEGELIAHVAAKHPMGSSNKSGYSENTEALAHAQETATHLTDWAARAFRKAIAEHEDGKRIIMNSPLQTEPELAIQGCSPRHLTEQLGVASRSGKETHEVIDPLIDSSIVDLNSVGTRNSTTDGSATSSRKAPVLSQNEAAFLSEETKHHDTETGTVADELKADILQLIELFGIPYVDAPAEAEAQCVALEELGLVDGIVTDDSDVFVFGGRTVYKNIFDDRKYVEEYRSDYAARDLGLGRNEMVALAMLMGGDYTDGVKGVGIVNGMEILQAFHVSDSLKGGLVAFRQWLDGFDPSDVAEGPQCRFHTKHKSARTRWIAPQYFPADNVLNAYVNPVVDRIDEEFSWGIPDLENLLVFCHDKLGWERSDTKSLLQPVVDRMEDSSRQTRLESYFMRYDDHIQFASIKSKRLRDVFSDVQANRAGTTMTSARSSTKQRKP